MSNCEEVPDFINHQLDGQEISSLHSEINVKEEVQEDDFYITLANRRPTIRKRRNYFKLKQKKDETSKLKTAEHQQTGKYSTRSSAKVVKQKEGVQDGGPGKGSESTSAQNETEQKSQDPKQHDASDDEEMIEIDFDEESEDSTAAGEDYVEEAVDDDSDDDGGNLSSDENEDDDVEIIGDINKPFQSFLVKNQLNWTEQKSVSGERVNIVVPDDHKTKTKYKCHKCKLKCASMKVYENHIRKKHQGILPKLTCYLCGLETVLKENLEKHMLVVHTDRMELEHFYCQLCPHTTIYKNNMKKHVLKMHKKEVKKCKVKQCKFWTLKQEDLDQHVSTLHEATHKCDKCGLIALSEESLKYHIENSHQKSRKFECDRCSYFTNKEYNLKNHIEAVHEKVRYPCTECKYVAMSKSGLTVHIRSKHVKDGGLSLCVDRAKSREKFKCEQCEYTTNRNDALKRHEEIVHMSGEVSYTCDMCSSPWTSAVSLQNHRRYVHGISSIDGSKMKNK